MTSLTIHLPDELAKRVEKTGVLQSPEFLQLVEQSLLQQEAKVQSETQHYERFKSYKPANSDAVTVTAEQIQKIIDDESIF